MSLPWEKCSGHVHVGLPNPAASRLTHLWGAVVLLPGSLDPGYSAQDADAPKWSPGLVV